MVEVTCLWSDSFLLRRLEGTGLFSVKLNAPLVLTTNTFISLSLSSTQCFRQNHFRLLNFKYKLSKTEEIISFHPKLLLSNVPYSSKRHQLVTQFIDSESLSNFFLPHTYILQKVLYILSPVFMSYFSSFSLSALLFQATTIYIYFTIVLM